ncbi:MAG: GH3 auxin-responsive promoter family protein [Cytophagaceae bacterium]|nr:GH3 auxin-responsive promoter family protein [Cytophagaceae bacterium]
MNAFKTAVLPYLIFPFTMIISVCTYLLLLQTEIHFILSTYIPLTFAGLSVTFFEFYTPYKKEWIADKNDVKHDMLFMVFIQLIFSKFLTFFTAYVLLKTVNHFHLTFQGIWPHKLPVLVQGIIMVLIIDFFRYWMHRASHNTKYLWRLHAVHHSPKKLYWLNVGRFHPIERSLQFLIDSFPFMLIGVNEKVLAMYFLFFAVNGFFQHCNIQLKYGFLNYIFSSAELHRWHHSRKIEESNNNYSNTTIIWDVLFGTRFLPKEKHVGELGLINPNYPLDFTSQMKTPFIGSIDKKELPLLSFKDIFINWLLSVRMAMMGWSVYRPLKKAAENPLHYQEKLLQDIIHKNQSTAFGKKYQFSNITDYEVFKKSVPVQSYEDLRPFIEEQEKTKEALLSAEFPVMYNQTSGTTGSPKYIPILSSTLKHIKRNQNIFSYIQYKTTPEGFYGKLLGLVSPAIEGYLSTGSPYGSASGLIYKNMPKIARSKYVIPYEVFEIADYTVKYYIILRLALAEKNITYLGSANPTTFLRMLEVIKQYKESLLEDIRKGTASFMKDINPLIVAAISEGLKPNPKRADELQYILEKQHHEISFAEIWPYLKIVTTWTGGSCGIALNKIKIKLPADTTVFELGYLSSEVRGTVTIDGVTNEGVLTFRDNFFEFVEKEKWENNVQDFLTIDRLETNKEYYIFITTDAGLYRYHMNDIVRVTGKFKNTPTIKFVQKGKGVVNITGEKLYESQVLSAIADTEQVYQFHSVFYQMLGDEEAHVYELYLEADLDSSIHKDELAKTIDDCLCHQNLEYKSKRSGERLKPLKVYRLQKGTFEKYKKYCFEKGQKEGQFKTVALLPKKDFSFSFENHLIP